MQLHYKPHAELMRGRWPFLLALFFAMLPLGAGPQGATEGSAVRQFVLVVLFLAAAFAVVRFPRRLPLLRAGVPLSFVLLLLYVAVSAIWSDNPWVSFKRVVQVIGVTVLAAGVLVGGNGQYRLHRLVPPVLWVGMALALVVSAALPSYAFSDLGYRAFMATKNNFGQLAVLCTLMPLTLLALEPSARRWVWWPLSLLGLAGLVMSRSATAAVALFAVVLMYGVVVAVRKFDRSWTPVILVLGILVLASGFAAGIALGFPPIEKVLSLILAPTGRDISLSGRTYLWELMVHEGFRHPWFGAGYGGFWLGLEGRSGQVAYLVKWGYPGQAHNGYLDLFNELGVFGCVLVFIFLLQHSRNVRRLIAQDWTLGYFHAALFTLVLVLNLAEATFLRTTHLWWILFVASVVEVTYLTNRPQAELLRARSRLTRGVFA